MAEAAGPRPEVAAAREARIAAAEAAAAEAAAAEAAEAASAEVTAKNVAAAKIQEQAAQALADATSTTKVVQGVGGWFCRSRPVNS